MSSMRALAAPVTLGREVDDESWRHQMPGLEDEHTSRLDLVLFACGCIDLEVLGPSFLKLKRDAASHDAHTVHRIDERFGFVVQDVASGVLDHVIQASHQ